MSPISHTMTFMPVASLADRPTTAAEGTVVHVAADDSTWRMAGGTWTNAGGGTGPEGPAGPQGPPGPGLLESAAVKAADQTTTLVAAQNITGLAVAVAANEIWVFDILLFTGCSGTGGVKVALTFPLLATLRAVADGMAASATARTSSILTSSGALSVAFNAANLATGFVRIVGSIVNGANAGTVQVQFAATTAGQTATIFARSKLHAWRVS